jgi:predicted transposase/invertase (TIGR01784 family)
MAKIGIIPNYAPFNETASGTPQKSNIDKKVRGSAPRLLPLKNDLVFKLIFGDHQYTATIRAFLIAALDIPAEEYEELEIIDPHLERDSPGEKLSILDVRVQLKNKKLISVEIQLLKTLYMSERVAFSTGRNLARQIGPGQDYAAMARVVTIVIADYDMIEGGKSYRHLFKLYDKNNGVLLTDIMEIHTLELGKLPEDVGADDKESELLDWLRLIRSESEEEIEMLAKKTEELKTTVSRLKQLSADERTRMLYEARQLYLMDEAVRLKTAVAEAEAKEKIKMVKGMLLNGIEIGVISRISGMSEEEIRNLIV